MKPRGKKGTIVGSELISFSTCVDVDDGDSLESHVFYRTSKLFDCWQLLITQLSRYSVRKTTQEFFHEMRV